MYVCVCMRERERERERESTICTETFLDHSFFVPIELTSPWHLSESSINHGNPIFGSRMLCPKLKKICEQVIVTTES